MSFINKSVKNFIKSVLVWVFIGIVAGILGGIIGSLFHHAVDLATDLRLNFPWLLFMLPAGGVLITFLYRLFRKNGALNTDRILKSARGDEIVPFAIVPLIFISSALSHLLGASVGREGAALQLGGGIGYNLGKVLRLNRKNLRIIVMSGMSAVFAALFGTPVTAVFFAVEVTFMKVMHYGALLSCTVSALFAIKIAQFSGLKPIEFSLALPQELNLLTVLRVSVLAALCAFVSILFIVALRKTSHYAKRVLPNDYFRSFAGGLIIIVLTLIAGSRAYNGAGMDIITLAMNGVARPEAFLLKIVFTAVSVAACFKGGEIVPAFFTGSTFGCSVGGLIGLDPSFGAAIGFVSVFCGIVDCPVASLILAFEVFGGGSPLYFALAVAISHVLSGNFSIYKVHENPLNTLENRFEVDFE